MRQKNIAVLMTALDSDAQTETLRGIEEYGKSHGYNIVVFLWYAGALERDKQNLGEFNIVYLPDLNLFDGVILFANAFHLEYNRRKLEELLEEVTCPVVTIGCKLENCTRVCTDNYAAMREMMEYFVTEQKMSKVHFVKGVEGNPDGEARYKAYVDVLNEHNIPVIPERVTKGDFYVTGGEVAVEEILTSDLDFPEAIVCANDIMAITICDLLQEKGYRVPEDVVISGYDYSVEGQNHAPKLTTIRSRFLDLGSKACKALVDQVDGIETQEDIYLPDEVILGESCGCYDSAQSIDKQWNMYHPTDMLQRKLLHQMIFLEKNIMEGECFEDWEESVQTFIERTDPTEFYCCVNECFVENVFELGVIEQEDMSTEEKLAYSTDVNVILAYKNGAFRKKDSFESRLALDDLFRETEHVKTYIFSPFHYLDRNFGYFVFVDSAFPKGNPMYISWLIKMGHAVETIRKQNLLKNAMSRLAEMYITDSLTGVYNRFGMERFFSEIKQKCIMSRSMMQLSFIDLDGLKRINDEYGHEEGDRIITAAANVLRKPAGKFEVIRYGGDEFIVMGTVKSGKEVEAYWKSVEEEIHIYNKNSMNKAELSLSYGYDVFRVGAGTHLADCIRVTDHKMYETKRMKKEKQ